MKYISIREPATKEVLQNLTPKGEPINQVIEGEQRPQEDYLITSNNPPVFGVADGVTLDIEKLIEENKKYPNPSPVGKVAKLFCKNIVESTKQKYNEFKEEDTHKVFKEANEAVGEYNKTVGGNFSRNPTGFYAATGAFTVIKRKRAYWASICDSFVAHFDKEMNTKFASSGSCTPYAVINGEKRMINHLKNGTLELNEGDRILIYTDGFEPYIESSNFLEIFKNWTPELREKVSNFSQKKIQEKPKKFGHERSLIAIIIQS